METSPSMLAAQQPADLRVALQDCMLPGAAPGWVMQRAGQPC